MQTMFSSAKAVQGDWVIEDAIEAVESLPNTPDERKIKMYTMTRKEP